MRRLLTSLLVLTLALSACARPPSSRPDAPPRHALFALKATRGTGAPAATGTTLLVVDAGSGSVAGTIPLGPVTAVSSLTTATGIPKLLTVSPGAFRELDLDTGRAETLAVSPAGVIPAGVGYTIDGNPVMWQLGEGGAYLEVLELAGPTLRSARADLRAPAAGAPQGTESRIVGPLLLMAADDAQAVFVNARPLPATGGGHTRVLFRADFHSEGIVQLGSSNEWPRSLPPREEARVGEAVRRWGVPVADGEGVAFFGLDDQRRASVTSLPPASRGGVVFQPGGETYLAVEDASRPATGAGGATRTVMERSMFGAPPRSMLETRPAVSIVPVGVVDGLLAYLALGGTRGWELRLRRSPGEDDSVIASGARPDDRAQALYLGVFEPPRSR